MRELRQAIPDANVLLALSPEELASKLLQCLKKTRVALNLHNLQNDLFDNALMPANGTPASYPREKEDDVVSAIGEAWAWLVAQGLVIPEAGLNGRNGFVKLSRRAHAIASDTDFAAFQSSRRLPKESLNKRIADKVWGAFIRGEFDAAVFPAMKAVEVAVREASGLGNDVLGVKLMRAAFNPETGPLTDKEAEGGERTARMELFAGAIGSYKNSHSHRDVDLDDAQEALETILLANHLLRIVDARIAANKKSAS